MIRKNSKPISDVTATAWSPSSGSTLYDKIDEVVPDDSDYINSTAEPNVAEVLLAPMTASSDGSMVINVRAKSDNSMPLTVQLRDGAMFIAESLYHDVGIGYHHLSMFVPDVSAITDFSNLRLRLIAGYQALLAEDGTDLLLEDGQKMLLEAAT